MLDNVETTKKITPTWIGAVILFVALIVSVLGIYLYAYSYTHISPLSQEVSNKTETANTTLKKLPSEYKIKDGEIYYRGYLVIKGADISTFQYVGGDVDDRYTKDKSHVYYLTTIIKEADPGTFQRIGINYAKDKTYIYSGDDIIQNANFITFKYIGGHYAKDKKNAYHYRWVIESADPVSFQYIGGDYAKDKLHIYYQGVIFKDVDIATFQYIGGDDYRSYAKDKENVYFGGKSVSGVDSLTFEYLGGIYAKDKSIVYYGGRIVDGADPNTFKVYANSSYGGDDQHAYFGIKQLNFVIDWKTFVNINSYYYKDSNHVYYEDKIVDGADPSTVELFDGRCAVIEGPSAADELLKDKNAMYCHEKNLEVSDLPSFKFVECTWSGNASNCVLEDKNRTYIGSYAPNDKGELDLLWLSQFDSPIR